MSVLWSDWPHTAISIESQSTDWSYAFSVSAITGGAVTGAAAGLDPPQSLSLIRAGLRIVPRLAVTEFNAGYAVSVVVGDGRRNYILAPAVNTTDTDFYIHQFQGQLYFLRGSGTTTADDGQTSLTGGTLIRKYPANYSGPMRLLAGFVTASDSIEGYSWDTLSSLGTVDPEGGAVATTGQATNTMGLLTEGRASAFELGTGDFGNPDDPPGDDTVDGVTTPVDIEDTGDDGTGVTYTYDDGTGDWTSEPITTVEIVDGDTDGGVITLPPDPDPNDTIVVVGINGGGTVDGDTETVGGSSDPYDIADGEVIELVFDGTTWVPTVIDDAVVIDTTAGDVDYTLPPNPVDGETVTIIVIGGGTATVGLAELGLAASASAFVSLGLSALALEGYEQTEVNYAYMPMALEHAGSGVDFSARGTATMFMGSRASENSVNGAFMTMPMNHYSSGSTYPFEAPYFDAYFFGTFSSFPYAQGETDINEQVFAYSDIYSNYVMQIRALATAIAEWQTFRTVDGELASAAIASSAQQVYLQTFMAEQGQVTTAALGIQALLVLESAIATGAYETYYEAVVELSSGGSALDAVMRSIPVELSDAAAVADAISDLIRAFELIAEAAEATSAVENLLTITVSESANAVASDGIESLAQYIAEVLETGRATIGLRFPDGGYVAWVMNTDGAMAVSQYDNFDFNSFAEHDGDLYAAGETGLYRMGGDTDAGTAIDASMRLLMQDFGSSLHKRVQSAYLGYTTDGELILQVKAVDGGQLIEHWFRADALDAAAPREQKVTLAKGIKSRYWQFELINVDGADFEVEELELHPLVLTRRV